MPDLYDKAEWHYGGKGFPKKLPRENGGTHMGFYITWLIENDFLLEDFSNKMEESICKVKQREITGTEFIFTECGEKLIGEWLKKRPRRFCKYYYPDIYLADYEGRLGGIGRNIYSVNGSWENYDQVSGIIDRRYRLWLEKRIEKI